MRNRLGSVRRGLARAGRWALAQTAFLFPFAVSVAANVAAGVRSGSMVLLVAGLVIPTSLFIAIEVWLHLPAAQGRSEWVRRAAMALPIVVAGGWSWLDITSLLLSQYPHPWWLLRGLCAAAPLSVDGLGVLAVYARQLPGPVKRTRITVPLTVRLPVIVSGHGTGTRATDRADDGHAWGGPDTVPHGPHGDPAPHAPHVDPPRAVPTPTRAPARTPSRTVPARRALVAVRTGAGAPVVGDDLDGLGRDSLRDIARAIPDMSVRGNAADLAARIRTHRTQVAEKASVTA